MKVAAYEKKLNTDRIAEIAAGVFFLVAMFTSLTGGIIIDSYTIAPNYLTTIFENSVPVKAGMFLELVNGICVIGIAAALYPFMKKHSERIALGYVGIRIIEAAACIAAAVIPLSYIAMSEVFLQAGTSGTAYSQIVGAMLTGARASITGLLVPILFGLGALLLYYILFRTKLVPRFLSVWGFVAAILVIALNLIEIDDTLKMLLLLPIIVNEIVLGIFLIVKGVRTTDSVASGRQG